MTWRFLRPMPESNSNVVKAMPVDIGQLIQVGALDGIIEWEFFCNTLSWMSKGIHKQIQHTK